MFYTKKDFYDALTETVSQNITALREATADLHAMETKKRSGKYDPKYIRERIDPEILRLKKMIQALSDDSKATVLGLCDTYKKQLADEDCLKSSDLTSDVNLLNAGVKLQRRDLEAMLTRNEGNRTMTRIILQYADQNKIDMGGIHYTGNDETIQLIDSVPYTAEIVTKWHSRPDVYDRLMGEGSELHGMFSDD